MATHKSAEKRARQSVKRAARNLSRRSKVRGGIRAFREAITSGDKTKAEAALVAATRELRKAASKGVVHARNASRRVSRLVLAFNKLG
ncbi:MAG: 30S ribosomal protein S20 [Clostridia bacterium]|nr:30S ribosomal protein S20 [Deltaproteobacteria bacterium]